MSQDSRIVRTLVFAALLLVCPAPLLASAQDTVKVGVAGPELSGEELTREVAERIIEFHNRASTVRFSGRTQFSAQSVINGDVAILGGPVELAGSLIGDVAIVNSDIELAPGALIDGNLTVVGGGVLGLEEAEVTGIVTTYASVLRYRRVGDLIEYAGSGDPPARPSRTRLSLPSWHIGDSDILVAAGAYNRVEGLPVVVGPRIRTGGSNPLNFEAFIIWRSESGFKIDAKDLGYEVRLRQWLFGHREIWIEGALWSIVSGIEDWQLTDLENSLSLFLFRRDYRDYFERTGWYAQLGGHFGSFFSELEYRDEDHNSRETGSPWTIFFNTNEPFPTNAAIDGGELRSLVASIGVDTRSEQDYPLSGWFGKLTFEGALGGSLSDAKPDFTRFFFDLRRYNRVSLGSVVALRFVAGGRVGGSTLPAQRQHIIGGSGSLPGYEQREFDCGARLRPDFGTSPAYGCQRMALFQAEYRAGLNFKFRWDDSDHHRFESDDVPAVPRLFNIELHPSVVLFYNAGAAWSSDEGYFDHLKHSDNWAADIGAGLDLGGFGFYLAYPLTGVGGVKPIVRLTARF